MAHPVVHAEIRSEDPDATRRFFADLFGWKVGSEGAFPGYTFIDTGVEGGTFVAISPRQSAVDEVLFFVAVEDVEAILARAEQLGGSIVAARPAGSGHEFRGVRRRPGPQGGCRFQRIVLTGASHLRPRPRSAHSHPDPGPRRFGALTRARPARLPDPLISEHQGPAPSSSAHVLRCGRHRARCRPHPGVPV